MSKLYVLKSSVFRNENTQLVWDNSLLFPHRHISHPPKSGRINLAFENDEDSSYSRSFDSQSSSEQQEGGMYYEGYIQSFYIDGD